MCLAADNKAIISIIYQNSIVKFRVRVITHSDIYDDICVYSINRTSCWIPKLHVLAGLRRFCLSY